MTSRKLLALIGCLVAPSSALPWLEQLDKTLYSPVPKVYNYGGQSTPTTCDQLTAADRTSRPELLKRCVCQLGNEKGRDYAYNFYGNLGIPKNDLTSILDECSGLSGGSSAQVSALDGILPVLTKDTRTSVLGADVSGKKNLEIEDEKTGTSISGFSDDSGRDLKLGYRNPLYPVAGNDGRSSSRDSDQIVDTKIRSGDDRAKDPGNNVVEGSRDGTAKDRSGGTPRNGDSVDDFARSRPEDRSEGDSSPDGSARGGKFVTVEGSIPLDRDRDVDDDSGVLVGSRPVVEPSKPKGGESEIWRDGPSRDLSDSSAGEGGDRPLVPVFVATGDENKPCTCSSVASRAAADEIESSANAGVISSPHSLVIPPGHSHHVGKVDDDEGEE